MTLSEQSSRLMRVLGLSFQKRARRQLTILALVAVFSLGVAGPPTVLASQLTLPATNASDAPFAGNVVALPINVSTALFHNPAQLSLLPSSLSYGLFAVRFHPSYENDFGYQSTSRELALAPNFGYVTDTFAPFQFAIGMYGSLGFMFNHMADPEHGVPNNFYTELGSISLAPSISYSLRPNLHLGVSLNPTYGRLKFKTPSPAGRVDVDARGPGIFSTVGILYQPTPRLNLGLSYKTPGNIWMFGNARVNGVGDDTTVSFKIPQNVKLGFAYRLTDRLTITGQGSWTEFSAFEDTHLRFDKHTFLNTSAVADAKDRWRLGAGVQLEIIEGVKFRAGFAYEPWAIKDGSLAPTLADTTDYLFPVGLSIERGGWTIDLAGSLSHTETRRASLAENPFFAGRYSLDETIFGVQMTRRFGAPPALPSMRHTGMTVPYARISDAYLTVSERRAEAVLDRLIAQISADQCHDLSPLSRAIRGCEYGIQVVGFVGAQTRPTHYAARADIFEQEMEHDAPEPSPSAGVPAEAMSDTTLDTLIGQLANAQCQRQALGQPQVPGCL